ncbi:YceI family protein [Sphingomonas sp. RS6]
MQILAKRYHGVAILLHWALALLLLFQLGLGWALESLPDSTRFAAFQFHKSVGILILVLSLARLMVRLMVRRPAPVRASPAAQMLVSTVHALLYAVMIVGPISGWVIVSTARIKLPTLLFGVVPLPHLPVARTWNLPAETVHGLVGWLLAGLFLLHVAGALRHHLMRDDVIGRMMPAMLGRRPLLSVAVAAALGACVLAFFAGNMSFRSGQAAASPKPAQSDSAVTAPTPIAEPSASPTLAVASPTPAASPSPSPSPTATGAPMPLRRWQVTPGGTLGFRVDYSGEAVQGRFASWTADIRFSPDDLSGSSITVDIDLASVGTGDSERDETLKGDDFFGAAAHPKARFTATRVRRQGDGYVADGTLALAGASRPLAVRFDLSIDGDKARASGTATVRRLAFGVGKGQWSDSSTVADAVSVTFRFNAVAR